MIQACKNAKGEQALPFRLRVRKVELDEVACDLVQDI